MTNDKYPADIIERFCEAQHDAYEAAAVREGWVTQKASRKPWGEVPEANKQTMRASVRAALDALAFTVTEEWGMKHPHSGSLYRGYDDEAHMRQDRSRLVDSQEWPIIHRIVLKAETPWMEVAHDAE